ncbi:glycerate kinase [Nocardioides sp. Soil805]|uniref:glycerate kinase n=1 Tax=Nocardioides sp. Soil805 TaxID=1736416 RepID=UPI0007031B3A|nr:glycerate kinase [Nocardioides sp. Soil805]KRF37851.1 glycerate kinase [Nocardioides sp. Soil805]
MTRVLVAPDKFKGTLPAYDVAQAVATGLRRARPDVEVECLPVADGGDGTLDAAISAGFERVPVTVAGPTGEPVETAYARRGSTAVVEMADACGLERLPGGVRAPLTASSRGLGEVMVAALDAGCRELVVGIGGSASTDGGAGLLAALGAVASPAVPDGGRGLASVSSLSLDGLHPGLADARVVVACDVDNPLTGPDGAAAVYGPQKGATPDDVAALDRALGHWADVVGRASGADRRDVPGAGAAGGVGFALVAALGAELRPGIALMLDLLGFADRVAGADLVVTGEGSLDDQSLRGKAPVGVATAAGAAGVPVVAVCGRRLLPDAELAGGGIAAAYALVDIEPDVETCLREPARLLVDLGERIGHRHLS